MTDISTMQQIVDFILELDRLKGVTRKNRPLGLERYENSAEHSWQIALLALSLAPHAGASIDVNRVVGMLLVHDIGEIDTGDTIVYAIDGWEERKAAELAAVIRIFGLLPEPHCSRFRELWLEFERAETPEAPLNDASFKLVFTPSPRAFRDAGWIDARLLGPDALPVPAGGADAGSAEA